MNYCPNCGEKIEPGKNFCSNCGERLGLEKKEYYDFGGVVYDTTYDYFSQKNFASNQRKRVCPIKELSCEERRISRVVFWLALLPTIISIASLILLLILMAVFADPSLSDYFVILIAPGDLTMLLISLFTSRNYKKDGGRYNGTLRVAFIFRIISTVISSLLFAVFLYSSIAYTIDPYLAYTFWFG